MRRKQGKPVTKSDVAAAIENLEAHLVKGENGDDDDEEDEDDEDTGKSMVNKSDLNTANGAADGGGDGSLKAPGSSMANMTNANGKKVKKSERPADVEAQIEVSDFLKSLVDHTGKCIDDLRDHIAKSDLAHEGAVEGLSEKLDMVQKSQAHIGVVLKAICERIGIFENAPATVAKSQTVAGAQNQQQHVAKSQVLGRQFVSPESQVEGEGGGNGEGQMMFKSLTGKPPYIQKSMIAESLCDLVRKGQAKDTDVINFETYGYVSPELIKQLSAVL